MVAATIFLTQTGQLQREEKKLQFAGWVDLAGACR